MCKEVTGYILFCHFKAVTICYYFSYAFGVAVQIVYIYLYIFQSYINLY